MKTIYSMFLIAVAFLSIAGNAAETIIRGSRLNNISAQQLGEFRSVITFPNSANIEFGPEQDVIKIGENDTTLCGLALSRSSEDKNKIMALKGNQEIRFASKGGVLNGKSSDTDVLAGLDASYNFSFGSDKIKMRCIVKDMGNLSLKTLSEILSQSDIRLAVYAEVQDVFQRESSESSSEASH